MWVINFEEKADGKNYFFARSVSKSDDGLRYSETVHRIANPEIAEKYATPVGKPPVFVTITYIEYLDVWRTIKISTIKEIELPKKRQYKDLTRTEKLVLLDEYLQAMETEAFHLGLNWFEDCSFYISYMGIEEFEVVEGCIKNGVFLTLENFPDQEALLATMNFFKNQGIQCKSQ